MYCRHLGLDPELPAVRIALRGAVGHLDHALLTWLQLDQPVEIDRLVDSVIDTFAGTVEAIAALDPDVDLRAARSEMRASRRTA